MVLDKPKDVIKEKQGVFDFPSVSVEEKTVGSDSSPRLFDSSVSDTQETALEDMEQELSDICRQQAELEAKWAELEAKREDVLKRIEEVKTLLRNEFYAGFYSSVLKVFNIQDDISQYVNKKQFDDYLTALTDKIIDNSLACAVKPVSDGRISLNDKMYWDTDKTPCSVFIDGAEYFVSGWKSLVIKICEVLNEYDKKHDENTLEQVSDKKDVYILRFDAKKKRCYDRAYHQINGDICVFLPGNLNVNNILEYALLMLVEFDKLAKTDFRHNIYYKLT